jgi:hypothetical protein
MLVIAEHWAAVLRRVILMCGVVGQARGRGQQTTRAVRAILRTPWQASSLAECSNHALRMRQAVIIR